MSDYDGRLLGGEPGRTSKQWLERPEQIGKVGSSTLPRPTSSSIEALPS
jgi:hypothetical protein